MWLLLISGKGGYTVHSAHKEESTCREWARCKEHDGEDFAVAVISREILEEALEISKDGPHA
jgi:hypothetical protein